MRISDWSSDVCSSDLHARRRLDRVVEGAVVLDETVQDAIGFQQRAVDHDARTEVDDVERGALQPGRVVGVDHEARHGIVIGARRFTGTDEDIVLVRSEEHTSELQSLMRISYAVFCLKKKTDTI